MKQPSHAHSLCMATRTASVCAVRDNRRLLRRRSRLRHSLTSLVRTVLPCSLLACEPDCHPPSRSRVTNSLKHIFCSSPFVPINVLTIERSREPSGLRSSCLVAAGEWQSASVASLVAPHVSGFAWPHERSSVLALTRRRATAGIPP